MLARSSTPPPTTIHELIPPALASALDSLDLASTRAFLGRLQGERRSKRRGKSVEFEQHRQYVPGDDLRYIDWNVFARLDRFFIKIFQAEEDLSLDVILDASASMDAGTPNKLIFAQQLAMCLAYIGLVKNNRVSAWVISRAGLRRFTPSRGRTAVQPLADFLLDSTFPASDRFDPADPTNREQDFAAALRTVALARQGTGLTVLLSDLLIPSGFQQPLSYLAAPAQRNAGGGEGVGRGGGGGWQTALLQVLSPGELDPAKETAGTGGPIILGDLRLTDAETGKPAEITVTKDVLAAYKRRLDAYTGSITAFARARSMDHAIVPSDTDLQALLLADLRARQILR